MIIETFYTFDDELNIIKTYNRQELINRINDYILNFDSPENIMQESDTNKYDYEYLIYKLNNTYSREHLFLIIDENKNILYKNGEQLNCKEM